MPMREDDITHGNQRMGWTAVVDRAAVMRREEEAVLRLLATAFRLGWSREQTFEALDVLGLVPAAERVRTQIKERKSADVVHAG